MVAYSWLGERTYSATGTIVKRTVILSCALLTGCAALGIDPAEFEQLPAAIPSYTTTRLANVKVRENLTYLRTF